MSSYSSVFSAYMEFYRFLPVMTGEQIWKLRKIAIGVLDIEEFTEEEIALLETKLHLLSIENSPS